MEWQLNLVCTQLWSNFFRWSKSSGGNSYFYLWHIFVFHFLLAIHTILHFFIILMFDYFKLYYLCSNSLYICMCCMTKNSLNELTWLLRPDNNSNNNIISSFTSLFFFFFPFTLSGCTYIGVYRISCKCQGRRNAFWAR